MGPSVSSRTRSSAASTTTTQPSARPATSSSRSGHATGAESVDVLDRERRRVRGARVVERVRAVLRGDHRRVLLGQAGALEEREHVEAGERRRGEPERAVQHRVERERLDPSERADVGDLAVRLDRDDRREPRADQHEPGRDTEQSVRGHRVDRPLHRAELIGHVLVEDRRALEQVLRAADERVDVLARVDAGVVVRALGRLEHQLLVGDAGGDRGEPRVTDPHDRDPRLHGAYPPIGPVPVANARSYGAAEAAGAAIRSTTLAASGPAIARSST